MAKELMALTETIQYPQNDERDKYVGGTVPIKSLDKKQKQRIKLVKK